MSKKLTYDEVKHFIEVESNSGYELISNEYINVKTHLTIMCNENHLYPVTFSNFRKGDRCPYCSNRKVLKGFNDMWTTNPELASQLVEPEDGYKYTQSSHAKLGWKCLVCGGIAKNKSVKNIKKQGLSCVRCSDGIKFPEKFMYNLLREGDVKFDYDSSRNWSRNLRYDFYLHDYNWIVEVHGGQHYNGGFERAGGRDLESEIENDRTKRALAEENDIENYIIIDARKSSTEWMKESIINSDLMRIVPEINFNEIGQLASNSFIKIASNMWSSGVRSTQEIADALSIHTSTVSDYLKRGAEIGWCDYSVEEVYKNNGRTNGIQNGKKVIQLSLDLRIIKEWESVADASRNLPIFGSSISCACRGVNYHAGGFKWMYKEDYDQKTAMYYKIINLENPSVKKVAQFRLDGSFVCVWDSIVDAKKGINCTSANISACCRGKRKTAGGFKWLYKEDYDKLMSTSEKQVS